MRVQLCLALSVLMACTEDPEDGDLTPTGDTGAEHTDATGEADPDADQDGHPASVDCNDDDASIHPGANELCNGIDDDCDDNIDEDPIDGFEGYIDLDQDGYGAAGGMGTTCDESLLADQEGDCHDENATIHPDAPELCDGLDNDCDDEVDDGWLQVPEAYGDIQGALDAASDGDMVCLAAGTWNEAFELGSLSVTIAGAGGAENTFFDLEGLDGAMTFVAGVGQEVVFQGFTITGLNDAEVPLGDPEGFLRVTAGSVTLQDMAIADNSWELGNDRTLNGGILAVDGASLTLRRVEIHDNRVLVEDDGTDMDVSVQGGILQATNADVTFEDVEAHGNTLVTVLEPGDLTLEGLFFRQVGGTLELDGLEIYLNTFNAQVNGTLDVRGGMFHAVDATVSGSGLTVDRNTLDMTTNDGNGFGKGLVFLRNGGMDLADVTLTGNSVRVQADDETRGYGPLYVTAAGLPMSVDHLTAHDNSVLVNSESGNGQAQGGGFWITAAATLGHVDARANTLTAKLVHGAGGYVGSPGSASSVTHGIFAGNTAGSSDAAEARGGGLYLVATGGASSVSHVTFHRNEASSGADSRGAGLAVEGTAVSAFVDVHHGTFTNNMLTTSSPSGTKQGADAWCEAGAATSLAWNNGDLDALGTGTNHVDVAAGYVKGSGGKVENWDLTLKADSELVDAGDPDCEDPDGTVCDIGAYGGPGLDW